MNEIKRIKVLNGYSAHARFSVNLSEEPIGYIPRQRQVSRPYSSGPTEVLFDLDGKAVFIAEISHRRYEVYEVPKEMIRKTEEECYG